MSELDVAGRVPPGAYLVSLSGPLSPLAHPELVEHLATAIHRVTAPVAR